MTYPFHCTFTCRIQIEGIEDDTAETRPNKGILKDSKRASKVSFKSMSSVSSGDSVVVTRDRTGSNGSNHSQHRRSSWVHSMYRVSTDAGGAASSLGVLVILKVIFVDILITGFGDAITDLLQVLKVCAQT